MKKSYLLAIVFLLTGCNNPTDNQETLSAQDSEVLPSSDDVTRASSNGFYTTEGIAVRNSGIGPETWYGSTTPYVPFMVQYADNEVAVPNAIIRVNWSKVEDENGYHFEKVFDDCFMQAFAKKQKVCLGIFPLDSKSYNTIKITTQYKGKQREAYIGYPEYIHNQLMESDEYRPRLYQNSDGSITDDNKPLYFAPDLRNPIVYEKYRNLLVAFRNYLDQELVYMGRTLCRRMLVREIQMRYWGYFGEGVYNYIGPNRDEVTIESDLDPEFDMESAADLIRWGQMFTEIFPDIRLIAPSNIFWQTGSYAEFQYWLATASNEVGEFGLFYDMWGEDSLTPIASTNTVWNGMELRPILLEKWKKAPIGGEPWTHLPTANFTPYSTIPEQVRLVRPTKFLAGNLTIGEEEGNTTRWSVSNTEKQIFRNAYSVMGFRIIARDPDYIRISRGHIQTALYVQNIGQNPVYEPWDIYYVFRDSVRKTEKLVKKSSFDIRTLMPSDDTDDVLKVRNDWTAIRDEFTDIPSGTYQVYLRISDPDGIVPNMRLAQDGYDRNGEYYLMTIRNY